MQNLRRLDTPSPDQPDSGEGKGTVCACALLQKCMYVENLCCVWLNLRTYAWTDDSSCETHEKHAWNVSKCVNLRLAKNASV